MLRHEPNVCWKRKWYYFPTISRQSQPIKHPIQFEEPHLKLGSKLQSKSKVHEKNFGPQVP